MAVHKDFSCLLDDLYCEEEKWDVNNNDDDEVEGCNEERSVVYSNGRVFFSLFPLFLLEQDLFWDDDELVSLFAKEQEQQRSLGSDVKTDLCLLLSRSEGIDWMLKVSGHYGFSNLTCILAVNYLDRFLGSVHYQRDKGWMIQLAAVTCLSLAAKVEETRVPLLLDLQVGETKYVFEAKTIQRMELLLLSTLKWKMHPVTPLSFLDHIIRRLGLKSHVHWEFFRLCEQLLLSVVVDPRFIGYLPSVMATATMMLVIDQVDPCNAPEYKSQLLGVLKISKEKVKECYELILELQKDTLNGNNNGNNPHKRKYGQISIPASPVGVHDVSFSCDNSNDSWAVESSVSSTPGPLFKKSKTRESYMPVLSLNRVFVDIVGSPN